MAVTTSTGFADRVIALGKLRGFPETVSLKSSAILRALKATGTRHVYADTASVDELRQLVRDSRGAVIEEIDGNTANQPLVRKVLDKGLDEFDLGAWAEQLASQLGQEERESLLSYLYALVGAQLAQRMLHELAGLRAWQTSIQLHTGLMDQPHRAREIGFLLRQIVPGALVKVPFAPHEPGSLLVARDLERGGVPVNFTSTFSARQVAAAALLCNATRTNVFMGRLNQALGAALLGEHVALEVQRLLRRLRREAGLRSQLIVASIREWRTLPRVAGCDVITAPCDALRDFLQQEEVRPGDLESRLETSYEDELGVDDKVARQLGRERIARLWRVEPGFLDFLREYRESKEFQALDDGDRLAKRFDEAGFGDFFHSPGPDEWSELASDKLPDPESELARELALDTHFTLRADADFDKHQQAMDDAFRSRLRD